MTEMIQPLRKLIDIKRYKGSNKLIWTNEGIEAFHFCYVAVSNCQDLYFFDDTTTPILQTDAYLTMVLVATCIWSCHQRTSPSRTILQQVPHRITIELVCERETIIWNILWRKAV